MREVRPWHRLLSPLAPIYRGVVTARIAAYHRGWLSSSRLSAPVISVGNLTFGGTGKTPTVIALVRDLVRGGRHPAVLTRGYGREIAEPVVLIGPDPAIDVRRAGDEPLEIARRLPGVPVVVDSDRVRGGVEALTRGADVLVMDDGFQHLKLERDLDLVLIDAGDPWGGGSMPPRGRLREPLSGLARADAILVTKVPADPQTTLDAIGEVVADYTPEIPILAARLEPTGVRLPDGVAAPDVLSGARVFAFAGLGRPEAFAGLLSAAGADVVGDRWFADHHDFSPTEIDEVIAAAAERDAVAVTTAKDAVKIRDDANLWVVEVGMVPVVGDWDVLWRLLPEVTG